MNAVDLFAGAWYRYHGEPALYVGRWRGQFIFEINTVHGPLQIRIAPRRLHNEITKL